MMQVIARGTVRDRIPENLFLQEAKEAYEALSSAAYSMLVRDTGSGAVRLEMCC
jgi:hypothetical protein